MNRKVLDTPYKAMKIRDLEEKSNLTILAYLLDCPRHESKKIDLYQQVSCNPRMPDKLSVLQRRGLIEQYSDPTSRSMTVSLTEKGEKVAEMIFMIEELME